MDGLRKNWKKGSKNVNCPGSEKVGSDAKEKGQQKGCFVCVLVAVYDGVHRVTAADTECRFGLWFCRPFNSGDGDWGPCPYCCADRIGRTPQSRGATSPHLTCALSMEDTKNDECTNRIVRYGPFASECIESTHRSPQSSHSKTGFHPILFAQISHFWTRSALEKNNSRGFQPPSRCRAGEADTDRFAPGLINVNLCNMGTDRIEECPLVALVVDGTDDWAVRYVWTESIESELMGVMLSFVEDVAPGVIGSDVAFGSG